MHPYLHTVNPNKTLIPNVSFTLLIPWLGAIDSNKICWYKTYATLIKHRRISEGDRERTMTYILGKTLLSKRPTTISKP